MGRVGHDSADLCGYPARMRRVWLIRAGENGERIDVMRRAGRIEMATSVDGMRMGDLVVSPNDDRHEVWLATVAGDDDITIEPVTGRSVLSRAVDWMGWLDRDAAFMRDQWKSIDRPLSAYELFNRDWWWNHVGSSAVALAPRPVWAKPVKPARAPSTRARSSTATPRVPKPAPKPKPKAVVPVLCAGSCGLVWSPYVLVDGLCADCRMS